MTREERKQKINNLFHSPGRPTLKGLVQDGTVDFEEFKEVFLKHRDITGYKAAMELIGDWNLWNQMLSSSQQFRANLELWKQELTALLKSEAISKVTELAGEGNYQAAKWVAEEGWNRKQGAGRPSKKEMDREARELAELSATAKEEQERVFKAINGGLSNDA